MSFPSIHVVDELGGRSLVGIEKESRHDYDKVKRILSESLAPEAVLGMQPLIDRVLDRYISKWRRLAQEGKVNNMRYDRRRNQHYPHCGIRGRQFLTPHKNRTDCPQKVNNIFCRLMTRRVMTV